jgi:hypothetical protein
VPWQTVRHTTLMMPNIFSLTVAEVASTLDGNLSAWVVV